MILKHRYQCMGGGIILHILQQWLGNLRICVILIASDFWCISVLEFLKSGSSSKAHYQMGYFLNQKRWLRERLKKVRLALRLNKCLNSVKNQESLFSFMPALYLLWPLSRKCYCWPEQWIWHTNRRNPQRQPRGQLE